MICLQSGLLLTSLSSFAVLLSSSAVSSLSVVVSASCLWSLFSISRNRRCMPSMFSYCVSKKPRPSVLPNRFFECWMNKRPVMLLRNHSRERTPSGGGCSLLYRMAWYYWLLDNANNPRHDYHDPECGNRLLTLVLSSGCPKTVSAIVAIVSMNSYIWNAGCPRTVWVENGLLVWKTHLHGIHMHLIEDAGGSVSVLVGRQ